MKPRHFETGASRRRPTPARSGQRGRSARPAPAPPPPAPAARWLGAERLRPLVERFFGSLCRPVRKNLALLVEAFVTLTAALRSGNGELSLGAGARALPLPTAFKQRYKRLNRFLDNALFDPQGLTEGLIAVLLGTAAAPTTVPVLLDQSTVGASQLLLVGRILPLALMTFTLAYAIVVALGLSQVAEQARARLEDPRAVGRHGTERILSARQRCGGCAPQYHASPGQGLGPPALLHHPGWPPRATWRTYCNHADQPRIVQGKLLLSRPEG